MRVMALLLLTGCVSPLRGEWIEADGSGHPLEGMDDCPGTTCVLDVIDLRKKGMQWLPVGAEPVDITIDIEVSGRSPVFGGGARLVISPDDPSILETVPEPELLCRVLADQMSCEPAAPFWVDRDLNGHQPSGLYLRAGAVYADDALEGD